MKKQPPTYQNQSNAGHSRKQRKALANPKRSEVPVQKHLLRNLFGIDPRSLALFRISIALLLLADLAIRATDLNAMYTDAGMFARAEIWRRITSVWNWSFHFASGQTWYQATLFTVSGILALALGAGFATRLAAIGSWLMLLSIHHRAPAILSGAEILLRMLLFWAMFLPLGAAWSVDRWRFKRHGKVSPETGEAMALSVASAAVLLQMGLMYFFSAIFKSNTQWLRGEALAGILAHDFYALPPAAWLLHFPGLLKVMTWATLALEWSALLLLFSPKWTSRLRLMVIFALAAMHIGIGICLEVGLFSYVSLAGLSLFLPPAFWDSRFMTRFRFTSIFGGALVAARSGESGEDTAPYHQAAPATIKRYRRLNYAAQGVALVALLYVLALNLNSLSAHPLAALKPENWRILRTGAGLSQSWGMFGEVPSMDGWYVARAKLRDGAVVDLLRHGAALHWKRPEFPARQYPNHFWHKLFREMSYFDDQGFQVYRAPVGQYLCRSWNARNTAEKEVADFEFIFCVLDKQGDGNKSAPRLFQLQLVRLDFTPGNEQPAVSGYGDAPQAGLKIGTP